MYRVSRQVLFAIEEFMKSSFGINILCLNILKKKIDYHFF